MRTLLWWTVGILAATFVFVGGPAAMSLRNTMFSTGGETAGLTVGGIPVFVRHFKAGMGDVNGGKNTTLAPGQSTGTWSGTGQPLLKQPVDKKPASKKAPV